MPFLSPSVSKDFDPGKDNIKIVEMCLTILSAIVCEQLQDMQLVAKAELHLNVHALVGVL